MFYWSARKAWVLTFGVLACSARKFIRWLVLVSSWHDFKNFLENGIINCIMLFKKKSSRITSEDRLSALSIASGIPLNNVKVGSGVTEFILNSIFVNDLPSYETFYKIFVLGYYGERLFSDDQDTKDTVDTIYSYAIGRNEKSDPIALATLVKAQLLDGEIGAVVQNAIIYAIAMYISWDHQHPEVRPSVDFATRLPNTRQPDKTLEQHIKDMTTNNPRAEIIAWSLCATTSKKLADVVVARMDYLLSTCECDKVESEKELGLRIIDEGML